MKKNDFILYSDETENSIPGEILDKINLQRSNEWTETEPFPSNISLWKDSDPVSNFYPTCENGKKLDCQENKSNEVLDESCTGILMFNSETSSCFCEDSNNLKRKTGDILRRGWSKYTRYIEIETFSFILI